MTSAFWIGFLSAALGLVFLSWCVHVHGCADQCKTIKELRATNQRLDVALAVHIANEDKGCSFWRKRQCGHPEIPTSVVTGWPKKDDADGS